MLGSVVARTYEAVITLGPGTGLKGIRELVGIDYQGFEEIQVGIDGASPQLHVAKGTVVSFSNPR